MLAIQEKTYMQYLVLSCFNPKLFRVFHFSESPSSHLLWLHEAFRLQFKIILLVLQVIEKSFARITQLERLKAWRANCIPLG